MNRTQKFTLNTFTSAFAQVVAMATGFIVPRIMVYSYGSEMNGLISSLTQFVSYLTFVEAGLSGAAVYSLYKPLADNNTSAINRIITAARKYYLQAGYLFTTGLFILAIFFSWMKSSETIPVHVIFWLVILLGVNGCSDFFVFARYRVLLTADQRSYVISSVSIVQTIIRTCIICVFASPTFNVVFLYTLALLPILIKFLFVIYYCKKNYDYLDTTNVTPDNAALSRRWDVIYQQILGIVQTGAPTIIATVILDFLSLSVLSIHNMIINGVNGVLSIFTSGLPAGFGEIIAKNEKNNLKKTVSEFEVAYYFILSLIYGVTFVMMPSFIKLYTRGFTDTNYNYPMLVFIIILNGLLYNIKTPQSMLIISAGMYKETRWRVTLQAIIIIALGSCLGLRFGLVGIIMGACLSNIYRTIDLIYFVPKYITNNNPLLSIRRMLQVLVNISLINIPLLWITMDPKNYIIWCLYAVGFVIYAFFIILLTTVLFDRKEFCSLIHRIKAMVLRR